jgi:hypothetical protein
MTENFDLLLAQAVEKMPALMRESIGTDDKSFRHVVIGGYVIYPLNVPGASGAYLYTDESRDKVHICLKDMEPNFDRLTQLFYSLSGNRAGSKKSKTKILVGGELYCKCMDENPTVAKIIESHSAGGTLCGCPIQRTLDMAFEYSPFMRATANARPGELLYIAGATEFFSEGLLKYTDWDKIKESKMVANARAALAPRPARVHKVTRVARITEYKAEYVAEYKEEEGE